MVQGILNLPNSGKHFWRSKRNWDVHMIKEEEILFPLCRELESAAGPVESHCGSITNPIRVMVREHDDAGQALQRCALRMHHYTPPEGVCNTYLATLSGLAEMEADMHQHVHKENNILFPKAAERERVA